MVEDAHWMTMDELTHDFHAHLHIPSAIQIGFYDQHPLYLTAERLRKGVLVIEAPGTASPQRGSHLLAWSLLNTSPAQSSLVVLDPQGDLKRLLAGTLGKTHTLFEISPAWPTDSLHYNPLCHVPLIDDSCTETKDRTTRRQLQVASALAQILAQPFSTPNLQYAALPELLVQALVATILHLRTTEPFAPFHHLQAYVRNKDTLFKMLADSPSERARLIFEQHLATIEDQDLEYTLSRVLSIITDISEFRSITVQNDIDFTCLLREPVALFLTPPLIDDDHSRILTTLFFTQLFLSLIYAYEDLEQTPQGADGAAPYHPRFVLDGILERCQSLPLQDYLPHLQHHGAELIVSGPHNVAENGQETTAELLGRMCATHLILNGAALPDCEHYARLCGSTTTPVQTPKGAQQKREPLLSPFALHTLDRGSALLYCGDGAPAIITLRDALDEQNSARLNQLNQPYTTNQGPCFDESSSAMLVGEMQQFRTVPERRNTAVEHASADSLFKELEQSMSHLTRYLDTPNHTEQ